MRTIRLFGLLLICFIANAQTEKNIDHQSLLWTRYYNQLTISNKWAVHTEFDNRIFINPVKQNAFVFRVQGRYKISNNVEVGTGYSYFSTTTQNPDVTYNFDTPEHRAQQDISWKHDLNSTIVLSNRFQVEERFIFNYDKDGLFIGSTFNWRFRYRLQGEFSCWKKENQYLKTIVYDELMINAGHNIVKNTFDQNRIYAGLQYGVNKNIAFELGYLKSFQQRASGVDYYDRDIIRFTFYHKIGLKQKQSALSN